MADEEQATRSAIAKRLTRQGHHVVVGHETGEALLEGLQHNLPDRVLLDVKIPFLQRSEAHALTHLAGSGVQQTNF